MSSMELAKVGNEPEELRDPVLEALFDTCMEEAAFLYRSLLRAKKQEGKLLHRANPFKAKPSIFTTHWYSGTMPLNTFYKEIDGETILHGQQIGVQVVRRGYSLPDNPSNALYVQEGRIDKLLHRFRGTGKEELYGTSGITLATIDFKHGTIDCARVSAYAPRPIKRSENYIDIDTGAELNMILQDGIKSLNS